MIIGIDGNEANVSRRVGISEYAFELLKQFKQYKSSDVTFKIYLKESPLAHMPEEDTHWKYILVKPKKLWTQIGLPLYLMSHFPRPDVFFTPSHYAPRFSPMPTAIAIMDLSYLYFPELFAKKDLYQLVNWTAYSARQARKIFTISKSSKDDIIKQYHISSENVIVTYPGIKEITSNTHKMSNFASIQKQYNISDNFILFVGTIQPRKNISRLIDAFSKIITDKKLANTQLVIVGKKGWLYEPILARPKELGIEQSIKFLDFVPDEQLEVLYQHALCYCLPSLYEGFGLPVLEAMQRGCPVVTSNISSLPEAGGDAALYVNPEDVNDIAATLLKVISDKKLRTSMIEKGYKQVKKFSWEETAKETLDVLIHMKGSI